MKIYRFTNMYDETYELTYEKFAELLEADAYEDMYKERALQQLAQLRNMQVGETVILEMIEEDEQESVTRIL